MTLDLRNASPLMSNAHNGKERGSRDADHEISATFEREQLQDAFRLMKGADSVELKLTIPESIQQSTLKALDIDRTGCPDSAGVLLRHPGSGAQQSGLVVRARRVQGKQSDSVVKMRPVDPALVSKEIRKSPSFGIEVDAMPGGYVCSGSMKGVLKTDSVRSAASGKIPLRRLFSKEQRAFFAQHAPAGIEMDSLSTLGPIFVLKLDSSQRNSNAASSSNCGSILTARESWSCRRKARRQRRSIPWWKRVPFWSDVASRYPRISKPKRRRHSNTFRRHCRRQWRQPAPDFARSHSACPERSSTWRK